MHTSSKGPLADANGDRRTPPLSGGTPWCVFSLTSTSFAFLLDNITITQREAVYKHFRFNSRTARQSILGMVVVPVAVFAVAYNQDVREDLPRSC